MLLQNRTSAKKIPHTPFFLNWQRSTTVNIYSASLNKSDSLHLFHPEFDYLYSEWLSDLFSNATSRPKLNLISYQ
jgi:hypothetical protein